MTAWDEFLHRQLQDVDQFVAVIVRRDPAIRALLAGYPLDGQEAAEAIADCHAYMADLKAVHTPREYRPMVASMLACLQSAIAVLAETPAAGILPAHALNEAAHLYHQAHRQSTTAATRATQRLSHMNAGAT